MKRSFFALSVGSFFFLILLFSFQHSSHAQQDPKAFAKKFIAKVKSAKSIKQLYPYLTESKVKHTKRRIKEYSPSWAKKKKAEMKKAGEDPDYIKLRTDPPGKKSLEHWKSIAKNVISVKEANKTKRGVSVILKVTPRSSATMNGRKYSGVEREGYLRLIRENRVWKVESYKDSNIVKVAPKKK